MSSERDRYVTLNRMEFDMVEDALNAVFDLLGQLSDSTGFGKGGIMWGDVQTIRLATNSVIKEMATMRSLIEKARQENHGLPSYDPFAGDYGVPASKQPTPVHGLPRSREGKRQRGSRYDRPDRPGRDGGDDSGS